MACRTQEVRDMVSAALVRISEPYGQDIIDRVAEEIERTDLLRYEALCGQFTKTVVNQQIGKWTSVRLGRPSLKKQATARLSSIITSYSPLP